MRQTDVTDRQTDIRRPLTMLMVITSLYAWDVSPAIIPEQRRFSTPSPSSFPMMSVMMYLRRACQSPGARTSGGGLTLLQLHSGILCMTGDLLFNYTRVTPLPGLPALLHVVAVHGVGGADAGVVLGRQVQVLEALRRNSR